MHDDLVPLLVATKSPPLLTADVYDFSGMTRTAGFEKGSNTHEDQTENMSAATQAQVHLAAESFYDDWLHRGFEEPVSQMNHYIYGMYVRRRPLLEAFSQAFPYRNFDPHYSKGDGWVQEILYAPQVPYLHGMTMPTASSDRATNALCHSVLLRPTRCPGKGHCRDIRSHSRRYIEMHNHSKTSLLHGTAEPMRAPHGVKGLIDSYHHGKLLMRTW